MIIGIVGSEAAKFTSVTEQEARILIRTMVSPGDTICSGECHLGGIDIWAKEEAEALGLEYKGFPPKIRAWEGGYKQRNLQIAKYSDWVYCITIKEYPPHYQGMKFARCYHCNTDQHVKSGGCWTVKKARELGKQGQVFVI